jgi:hypothetical protein
MEITGKLALILDAKRGESARGAWLRSGFVLDVTEGQYTRKIAFSIWGEDKYNALKAITIGTTIQVIFNIESREWESNWYTDCRCSQINTFNSSASNNNGQQVKQEETRQPEPKVEEKKIEKEEPTEEDDLPF